MTGMSLVLKRDESRSTNPSASGAAPGALRDYELVLLSGASRIARLRLLPRERERALSCHADGQVSYSSGDEVSGKNHARAFA